MCLQMLVQPGGVGSLRHLLGLPWTANSAAIRKPNNTTGRARERSARERVRSGARVLVDLRHDPRKQHIRRCRQVYGLKLLQRVHPPKPLVALTQASRRWVHPPKSDSISIPQKLIQPLTPSSLFPSPEGSEANHESTPLEHQEGRRC